MCDYRERMTLATTCIHKFGSICLENIMIQDIFEGIIAPQKRPKLSMKSMVISIFLKFGTTEPRQILQTVSMSKC